MGKVMKKILEKKTLVLLILGMATFILLPLYVYSHLASCGTQVQGNVAGWLVLLSFIIGLLGLDCRWGLTLSGMGILLSMLAQIMYVKINGLYYWNFLDPRWGKLPVILSEDIVYWFIPLCLLTIVLGIISSLIGNIIHYFIKKLGGTSQDSVWSEESELCDKGK